MTAAHEATAQRLLNAAAEAQTEYWDAVKVLEEHLKITIEDGRDLSEETVETLVEANISDEGDDDGEDS